MIEKEFVTYEQALALKELEFDEPCLAYYNVNNELTFTSIVSQNTNSFWLANPNNITSAPLKQQAFKFFRDNYNLHCEMQPIFNKEMFIRYYRVKINDGTRFELGRPLTYKEAELACIDKLIELVKEAKEL